MNVASIPSHNFGVRRALVLAREVAALIETEAGTGTERDKAMIEALCTFADQAAALLLPEPDTTDAVDRASEEDDDG